MLFEKVCDREFNKNTKGVYLFSLKLNLQKQELTLFLYPKGIKSVSRYWGLLPENFGAIVRSFDKSRKLMTLSHNPNFKCIFEFSH